MQRLAVVLFVLVSTALLAQQPKMPQPLEATAREFMSEFFSFQPSAGTRAGYHEYDDQLEDFSRERVRKQIERYRSFERQFEVMDTKGWPEFYAADRDMMLAFVRSRIFELETQRVWERDPDHYSAVVSDSTFLLMGRSFAPAEQRLRSLVARQRKAPALFAQARQNLKNPPRVFTEIAIDQLPGIISFFEKDVPAAFAGVKDEALIAEFRQTNAAVVRSMREYLDWLKRDLLPRSKGDFRLGAANYQKKLQLEEMVDVPLDRLLAAGYENLRRNQKEFARVGKLIDPAKTPAQILSAMEKDHPPADRLLQEFRDRLTSLREFTDQRKIVATPERSLPIVKETEPFMRALSSASMDTPGPFEQKAKEAYFSVTLPEPNWTPQQVEEHLAGFNYGSLNSTAIHEVFPGHYLQYLWNDHVPSFVRQFLSLDLSAVGSHFSGTNVEGWAHYTEQMMLDEGFGRNPALPEEKDKEFLELRLGQLQDALLRNARYIVGVEMHTGKMTFDEGVAFFQKEGYQTKANAFRETRRGTADPTYLMYTLGKLQIIKLREDLRKQQGAKFDLQRFHDEFMRQGVAPVSVIRKAMLGNSSPAL
ncbi:MAG TPA: DUF885 domain-containing protein [Clostridia bacterium]|nr:DUF885 domain-containing protein [Clostridia bacterium]